MNPADERGGSSLSRRTSIPQRHSLVAQTAEAIGERIRDRVWVECLPAERQLCRDLQVSRKTLRAALEELERQGWITVSGTRRRAIPAQPPPLKARSRTGRVMVLGATPLSEVHQLFTVALEDVQSHIHRDGFEMDACISPRLGHRDCTRTLAKLVRQSPADCWILWSLRGESYRWFAQRGLPAVVFGSREADIPLSSVDIDYLASAQHAVDLMRAKGHRRFVLLVRDSDVAGYRQLERGFLAACGKSRTFGDRSHVVRHDGTVPGICRALDALFPGKSQPTALLVADALEVLTVFGHLTRMGLRVPDDVSLISQGDDPCLRYLVPRVSRYTVDPLALARTLSRLVIQSARGRSPAPQQVRIMPRFVTGESVAAAKPSRD